MDSVGKTPFEAEREQSAIRNYPQLLRRYARLLEVTYNLASTFDLNTGRPRSLPATAPVDTYVVTTENDDILIEVTNCE